jgi:hypothetical protein
MLNADKTDTLNCVTHLDGLIAIMRAETSLSDQQKCGIRSLIIGTGSHLNGNEKACTPSDSSVNSGESDASGSYSLPKSPRSTTLPLNQLVSITPKVTSLFRKASNLLQPQGLLFEAQLTPLREEAIAVRSELLAWCARQPSEIRPIPVERFTQSYNLLFPDCRDLTCISLRADSYPDRRPYATSNRPRR